MKKTLFFAILILSIGLFFRLFNIASVPPGLYPDEAMNGNNIMEALHTGTYKWFYPENNGREGLFINIQAAFLQFFGVNEPWVLRLPSAIFGTLTVLGIFFLARELFSVHAGLLSSLLLATSFWHIMFSRIGFRAIMAPFFLVWAVYYLLQAFRGNSSANQQILFSIFSGALFGLGFYTYISYRVMPLLLLLFIPFFSHGKNFRRVNLLFILTTFLVALPIGLYYLNNPADFLGRTAQVSVFSSPTPLQDLGSNIVKTAGMFNLEGDWNWRHNYAGAPQLFWPVGILFLIGCALAIKNLIQSAKINPPTGGQNCNSKLKNHPAAQDPKVLHFDFSFLILLAWLFLAALPVVISNEGLPHALRAILMLPPVVILAAVGGVALYNMLPKNLSRIVMVIVIVILAAEPFQTYFGKWATDPNATDAFAADYVAIGREMNRLPKETQKYVEVVAGGVDVRGIPMPAQTVMFITDSFTPEQQREKNIHYVLPGQTIPPEAKVFQIQ